MLIKSPGKVLDRLEFLGTWQNCLYLLKGKEAMIVGGGMSWIAPELERQIASMDFDLSLIRYLAITHSHFDHCGAVPYLKRKLPQVNILASSYARRVFSNKKAVQFIASMNEKMIARAGLVEKAKEIDLQFDTIQIDQVAADMDTVDLGDGIEVRFLEVPGHTKCSIALYVPALKILFPSDSATFPTYDGKGIAQPSPQYDFRLYKESLKKLASLDVETCAFEHHGVLMGEEARRFLRQAIEQAEEDRKFIMTMVQNQENLEEVVQKLAGEFQEQTRFPFLTPEVQKSVAETVVRKILQE
ncbi:MAG: MBL fold metallo-hydrolase [Thermodesulfobacteriota bacterium]|nr:MBL fold metallo-hydrolase [Thermodesulfobacteriota bacterium]